MLNSAHLRVSRKFAQQLQKMYFDFKRSNPDFANLSLVKYTESIAPKLNPKELEQFFLDGSLKNKKRRFM